MDSPRDNIHSDPAALTAHAHAEEYSARERDLTRAWVDRLVSGWRFQSCGGGRMRRTWLALVAAGAVSVAMPAAARDFPYCIKGCDFGAGAGDCSFSSLAQCQATASGQDA